VFFVLIRRYIERKQTRKQAHALKLEMQP